MNNYSLKMLGLFLYTLIISHISCNMLSILNNLTLLKKLQNCRTNNVFLDKKVNTQQQNNQTLKPLPEPEIEPWTSRTQRGCVTSAPPSQMRVMIVVKLFNCFKAIGRNVNKQSRIWFSYLRE